jgi:hypothetical protein
MRLEGDERQVMALRIKETLLSARALDDSRRVLLRAVRGRKTGPFTAPVPWPEEVIRARLENPGRSGLDRADDAALTAQLSNWVDNYSDYRPSDALRSVFRNAVADVLAAGSEVVVFVPPLSRCELEVMDQTRSWDAFQAWKTADPGHRALLGLLRVRKAGSHGLALPGRPARLARRGAHHASRVPRTRLWTVRRSSADHS